MKSDAFLLVLLALIVGYMFLIGIPQLIEETEDNNRAIWRAIFTLTVRQAPVTTVEQP